MVANGHAGVDYHSDGHHLGRAIHPCNAAAKDDGNRGTSSNRRLQLICEEEAVRYLWDVNKQVLRVVLERGPLWGAVEHNLEGRLVAEAEAEVVEVEAR